MTNYLKKVGCLILPIFLILLSLGFGSFVHAEEATTITKYIKNDYTVGAYLYDNGGTLRYGIPLEDDEAFQWNLISSADGVLIQNVKTENYITMKNHSEDEGSSSELVRILPIEAGNDTFYWDYDITDEDAQNIVSNSSSYSGFVLHLEGITDGHAAADILPGGSYDWGNVLWKLFDESEINFSAIIRDGFVIQSALSGEYLYTDGTTLSFSVPTTPDDGFIFSFLVQPDGTKYIKNKETNTYLSTSALVGEVMNLSSTPTAFSFQVGKNTSFVIGSNALRISNDHTNLLYTTSTNASSELFNIIPASQVPHVVGDLVIGEGIYNLKNAWFSMYLLEDEGNATYGNASPSDPYAQWQFAYDETSGFTSLQNVGSGHFLHAGDGENGLIVDSVSTFYWKLLRNTNDLYPDAVVFRDSVTSNKYLHMESRNGFAENSNTVQPTWGTPHWIPILYDESSTSSYGELVDQDDTYIRIKSTYKTNNYLYVTASGGVAIGDILDTDARSQFRFVYNQTTDSYYLENRAFTKVILNMGNGVLRAVEVADVTTEGAFWNVYTAPVENSYLIANAYTNIADYLLPYLNISTMQGFALSTLVSIEDKTTVWVFETAVDPIDDGTEVVSSNIPLTAFTDTNLYKVCNNGKVIDGTYVLEYYGTSIRIKDNNSSQYLYQVNDKMRHGAFTNVMDPAFLFSADNPYDIHTLSNGGLTFEVQKTAKTVTYSIEDAFLMNDEALFSVYADEDGLYSIELFSNLGHVSFKVELNGVLEYSFLLMVEERSTHIDLNLRKGINIIRINNASNLKEIVVYDTLNINYRGASSPYTLYEAEDMETNATVLEQSRIYRSLASEASGRTAVTIDKTSGYVRFTLQEDTNALTLRYSIPDSADGVGNNYTLNLYIDGVKKQAVMLSSVHSWLYGQFPWTNNPSDGLAHVFYDEVSILLGETIPAGSVVMLRKDVDNYSASYTIDFVETELVGSPLEQPLNSLSIIDYGAIPNDGLSDSDAFHACVEAATTEQKMVWIPEGTFDIHERFNITSEGLTIKGAGMWHSKINGLQFLVLSSHVSMYDFALEGDAVTRLDSTDFGAIESMSGNLSHGLVVSNLWITHYKVGLWINYLDDVFISGNRIRNTYADGINLHAGVKNARIEQNDIRYTGDDGIGLWSDTFNDEDVVIRYNTISLPWLANAIAIYGGKNITVTDNILSDTIYAGAGVNISTNFAPEDFSGNILVGRNTLLRTGSDQFLNNVGGVWFNTILGYDNLATIIIYDNLIQSSTYQGISFSGSGTAGNVYILGNVISKSGTWGIEVLNDAKGTAVAKNNLIVLSMLDKVSNGNEADFSLTVMEDMIHVSNRFTDIRIITFSTGAVALIGLDTFVGFKILALLKRKKGIVS